MSTNLTKARDKMFNSFYNEPVEKPKPEPKPEPKVRKPRSTKLGECLTQRREKHNLTQKELARKLKMSQSVIHFYECCGTYPTLPVLEAMADLYECTLDELVGRKTK